MKRDAQRFEFGVAPGTYPSASNHGETTWVTLVLVVPCKRKSNFIYVDFNKNEYIYDIIIYIYIHISKGYVNF